LRSLAPPLVLVPIRVRSRLRLKAQKSACSKACAIEARAEAALAPGRYDSEETFALAPLRA